MPPIEHECPVVRCDLGEGGRRYKTPPLPSGEVLQLLTFHNHNHVQPQGLAVAHGSGGATAGCQLVR